MTATPAPGTNRRRQFVLAAVPVIVVAVVLWYQFALAPAAPAPTTSNATAAPQRRDTPTPSLPEEVRLGELTDVPENSDVGRNPFGYGIRPAPPPPPQPVRPILPPVAPPPPVPQGPPPIQLKLTGLTVVPESKRTMVTLRDSAGTLFQAFEGDIVDGRYRVVKVGTQSVVLAYVDGSGMRTIPLGS